jgi:hypothetical protein
MAEHIMTYAKALEQMLGPHMRAMFHQINLDCAASGETVVPLDPTTECVEYYAEQVENIEEARGLPIGADHARRIAWVMLTTPKGPAEEGS